MLIKGKAVIDKTITVLISCVGRQVNLVHQFQDALPSGCRVITADADPMVAGAFAANVAFVSPKVDDVNYINWILDLCEKESVSLAVSLLPTDLIRLEGVRRELKTIGTQLIGMTPDRIRECLNKKTYSSLCQNTGFHALPVYLPENLDSIPESLYPLVAKESSGCGSRGMRKLVDSVEAKAFVDDLREKNQESSYMLQPFLSGQEYGLDLVNDLDGNSVAVFLRRKIRMRNGETDVAETVTDDDLVRSGRSLALKLKHQGVVDCDVLRHDGIDYLLDINVRFGGGYIFSQEAGGNVPAALVAWFLGRQPDPLWLFPEPGITLARTSTLQRLKSGGQEIVVITTANHEIGMGHAYRQIAVASAANRSGHRAIVVTNSTLVVEQAVMTGVEVFDVALDDRSALSNFLESISPSVVLIDVHERDFPNYGWVSERWHTTLVVSRVGYDFDFYGEKVILVGEDMDYWRSERRISSMAGVTRVHAGRAYISFRDEFLIESITPQEEREPIILIAHGGSDPHKLTQRCLRALSQTEGCYKVNVLVGPAFDDEEKIQSLAALSKHQCNILVGKSRVAQYMSDASLAIINGGNVRYELCLTSTPFIALSIQQSQYEYTERLATMGAGINLGLAHEIEDSQIAREVDRIMRDKGERKRMAERMSMLFDASGAKRLVACALQE